MNRRELLAHAGILSASTLVAIGTHGWAVRTNAQTTTTKRLIVIFLRGAVDGLSVVVPYQEAIYYNARPKIAIPQPGKDGGALDLDGQFGLHPALSDLLPLWQQKSLAFIPASGSPDASRSHFDAQDYMESGTPGVKKTPDGWMNRLLAVMSGHNPIQAVNVGATTPRILSGRMAVASIALGRGAANAIPLDRPQVAAAFDKLYDRNDTLSQTYREGRTARKALLQDLDAETKMANNGAPLPNGFASDARRLANVMLRDPKVELAFMALGGWDTHVNQGSSQGQLARNLNQLGKGLAALQSGLGAAYANTTIVVLSEFGRTVHENGNGGTDHGHGNVMWVLGGNVKGGKLYGQWEGLAGDRLYQGRDVPITTDFRAVISPILTRHMGLNQTKLAQVFPGYTPGQSVSVV
ncbi:DUF1501 domain-containing protein [Stenomitos frigidus]|uniref:DUF1501 domain-containing protein n=1 Tax=Stenomitos frigidus ULC18 TaxID=2107698 RepID=A0A2T1DXA6_9CYAN|nr:DUF1501 domain-containing protein [Stenomitos frigidus]PSB25127.1 hypothetical protein C7B82_24440 [Stenomitos frigidus ULC18]